MKGGIKEGETNDMATRIALAVHMIDVRHVDYRCYCVENGKITSSTPLRGRDCS